MAAIHPVTGHRVTEVGHMNPDLMRSAGFNGDLDQTEFAGKFPQHLPGGGRMPSIARPDCHLLAIDGVATDRRNHPPLFFLQHTMHQGQIFFIQLVIFEYINKFPVHKILLGDQHNPRGILVEPVDDTRP